MAQSGHFSFVQLDLPGPLGLADGRYLLRAGDDEDAQPEAVVVLRTQGEPPRAPGRLGRLLRRRRPRPARGEERPAAAVARATVIRAAPASADYAARRLTDLRSDREALGAEVGWGVTALNRLLHAHRAATADPTATDVAPARALAVRVGHGTGEQVAEGRFAEAVEVPAEEVSRRRREALVPEDRLTAVLTGRVPTLAAEELVIRARLDLDAGRPREAALQARIALEALLAELGPDGLGPAAPALEADREPVAQAANAALSGDPPDAHRAAVAEAVVHMEAVLRRRRAVPR